MNTRIDPIRRTTNNGCYPYVLFSYSIRSPYTKETYFRRLRSFFDAISVDGSSFEERRNLFAEKGKQNPTWAFNSVLRYTLSQKERMEKNWSFSR
jgi:hypothetical protein